MGISQIIKQQPTLRRAARKLSHSLKGFPEPEVGLLPFIVDRSRAAIDVGAHNGLYTGELLKLCRTVIAIEAIPDLAHTIERMFPRAAVIQAAASSEAGTIDLRIPDEGWGLSTVAAENELGGGPSKTISVPMVRLDDVTAEAVGFIKVDVEGHELEVLMGGSNLIERDRPNILIEAEERHRPDAIPSIRSFLEPLGYKGFVLVDGRLSSIDNFDANRDQNVPADQIHLLNQGHYKGRYLNNFLFVA